ncbi:MAG: hypothetical protein K2H85_01960, partial [Allobaculum sp.]|nr:hypothetical protein [Allobaculum sp.]
MATTKKKNQNREPFLKRIFLPKQGYDPWILGSILVLMLFGTIMVTSTQMASAIGKASQLYVTLLKQLFFSILGWEVGIVMISRFFNYKRMRAIQGSLEIFYLLLLIATAIIGSD